MFQNEDIFKKLNCKMDNKRAADNNFTLSSNFVKTLFSWLQIQISSQQPNEFNQVDMVMGEM